MPDSKKTIEQLATYFSGSNVAAASIGLQLGGHALTMAQPYFAMREALGITGYATHEEAVETLSALFAHLSEPPHNTVEVSDDR